MNNLKHDLIITLLKRELPKLYLKYSDARVDCGGCGFIANFIYNGFKHLGYNPQVRVLTRDTWFYQSDKERIEEVQNLILSKDNSSIKTNMDLYDMGLNTTHIMVLFHGHYIDLSNCYNGLSESQNWFSCKDSALLTPEILQRITSSYDGWNDVFKSEYVDEIGDDIKKVFDKIKSIVERPERFHKFLKFHESGLLRA